jgi:hypothetical protein
MYQGSGLEREPRVLTANAALCDPSQLIVNQRSQLIERGAIAGPHATKQFRDEGLYFRV